MQPLHAALGLLLAGHFWIASGWASASEAIEHRSSGHDEHARISAYSATIRHWRTPEDINAWIAANFRYDHARAALLSESQRALIDAPEIYSPQALFATPRGVCVDLARFAVETLRAVAPELVPKYVLIEFEPTIIAGQTYRLHWVASFERSGMRYFFADSNRPGHIAGPFATTREYVDEYAQYRARQIVSLKELGSYQRRAKVQAQKRARESVPAHEGIAADDVR